MQAFNRFSIKTLAFIFLWIFLVVFPRLSLSETINVKQIQSDFVAKSKIVSLSGIWKFKSGDSDNTAGRITENTGHWEDIRVPANWYLEEKDIGGVAWYSKYFTLPVLPANKRILLKFYGVDYITEVWLNGKYIGMHEGYFQSFSFDITKAVVFGKENLLMVKVNSPLEKMVEDWSLHKRYIKGIFGHHDTRPGGAWSARGQEKNTGGIWGEVNLEIHEPIIIDDVKVTPSLHLPALSASANIQVHVESEQASPKPVTFQFSIKPFNFPSNQYVKKEIQQTLKPGFNSVYLPITVDNPELWWPWDQGKANLYQLSINVVDKGAIIDSKTVNFGFRDVHFDKAKNEWHINGRRMFLRGTNYIATQWLSEMTPERFAQDIALMKAANINIARVHAHVTSEDYYRLCDEAGLLNWQDFPLQWGYVEDDSFTQNAVRQARDMVNQLFNHPSIIAWSLINEPAWDAEWMVTKYKHYRKGQNKSLTDTLYQAINPMDKTRYVHPYSASAEHPWLGWYSGSWLDYNKPTKISIVAEYGAQALPDIANLRKIIPEVDLWPVTDAQWDLWEFHNFRRKETFKYAKIPKGNTPAEFIHNTQAYQAKLTKLAAESYRRQRYQPVSGIFQFMLVEDWPSMNWGILDYWRSPKQGYFALKQAYQPVLPSIEWKQEAYKKGETASFELWAINDLPNTYKNAKITYSLRAGKNLLETHELTENIAPDSGRKIKTLSWNNLNPGHYELVYKIADNKGNSLGVNSHEFDIKP